METASSPHKPAPESRNRRCSNPFRSAAENPPAAAPAASSKAAVLVPPVTMGHVERISRNLEKMPPKSTYFYPKLLSGLVFNSLKGN